MNNLFIWIEATRLSTWTRESTSVFAFPGILAAHAIGMGLAAGVNAAFALHLLGVTPGMPRGAIRRFVPIMWLGFWLNAVSGVLLLIAYPTKALTNPVFYLKIFLIASAIGIFTRINRRFLSDVSGDSDSPGAGRMLGALSLFCWAGAITSGRLLAYTYTRLFATW